MDNHIFYLVSIKNKNILKDKDIYCYILDIDKNIQENGFKGLNIIDKTIINDDFICLLSQFLIFIPNDTPEEIQVKSNFGLNYYGITILKNSDKIYNIFSGIYKIFEQAENEFFISIEGNISLLTSECYNNLSKDEKYKYKKICKEDILYFLRKLKKFALKIKEENFYIIHFGI